MPLITAGGTIVAAVITGFLAAILKHRWDRQADAESWRRERVERRREELRIAFAEFLRICRQSEEIGNRLWYQNAKKRNDAAIARRAGEGDPPRRDDGRSSSPQDRDDLWYSKVAEAAAAADLLIMLLGIDVAEPFRRHMIDLRQWIADMMDRGDRGDGVTPAPPQNILNSLPTTF